MEVSGTEYTFDVAPVRDGNFTVDIAAGAAHTPLGSPNTEAPQFKIRSDRTAPTPSITGKQTGSGGRVRAQLYGRIRRERHRL